MNANGKETCDAHGFSASTTVVANERSSEQVLREKHMFWIERPVRRFVTYFCVLVAAETLVFSTLHWIFHLV